LGDAPLNPAPRNKPAFPAPGFSEAAASVPSSDGELVIGIGLAPIAETGFTWASAPEDMCLAAAAFAAS